ncbi:RIP metalloprotease RseP [Mycoplasmatota bacterium]|nr:RIP metalloprotease RseP [Mycoplasmatota bacterium]
MTLLLNLVVFIFVLGIIVLIHEGGHFYFARKAGILCHEFSIGMGPALWQKNTGDVVYSIRAIPIGGFVSMAGEGVSDAMFKKDQTIGLVLNEHQKVKEIILYKDGKYDISGVVKDFDLYGKDKAPLYIEIENEDGISKYEVERDAMYQLGKKSTMWVTPEEKSFESKTLWQRFLTIFGGPLMNFILAFVLFFMAGFFVLQPNYDSNEIGEVSDDSAAAFLNLESGDKIVSINGVAVSSWYDLSEVMSDNDSVFIDIEIENDGTTTLHEDVEIATYIQSAGISNVGDGEFYTDQAIVGSSSGRASSAGLKSGDVITAIDGNPINNWDELVSYFSNITSGGEIIVSYDRDGDSDSTSYNLISEESLTALETQSIIFQIGVTASGSFDLGYSLLYAPRQFGSDVSEVFTTIGLLFGGGNDSIGISDLSGPVGIFQLVSTVRENGFLSLIIFMGFLSINIGILNLLPIPALDGGRLVFLGIEAITRKPLNRKIENYANLVMFFALIALIIFVSFNDIFRLINS